MVAVCLTPQLAYTVHTTAFEIALKGHRTIELWQYIDVLYAGLRGTHFKEAAE